jgi:hypothetical protein
LFGHILPFLFADVLLGVFRVGHVLADVAFSVMNRDDIAAIRALAFVRLVFQERGDALFF